MKLAMKTSRKSIYAVLGQLLLVFVGVVLALAADDWRQSQQDLEEGRAVLESILQDLQADSTMLSRIIEPMAALENAGRLVLSNSDKPDFPADAVEQALDRLFLGAPYVATDAAFRTAVSTGRIDLIPSRSLQNLVVSYFESSQGQIIAFHAERVLHSLELIDMLGPHLRPSNDVAGTYKLDSSWEHIRSDNSLLMKISQVVDWSSFLAVNTKEALEANSDLQRLIFEALDRDT